MKKVLIALAALAFFSLPARADVFAGPTPLTTTGDVILGLGGAGTTILTATGSVTTTFALQGSSDPASVSVGSATWTTLQAYPVVGGSAVTSMSAAGKWAVATAGMTRVRTHVTALSGGTLTLTMQGGPGPCLQCSTAGGGGGSGTVTSITPGAGLASSVPGAITTSGTLFNTLVTNPQTGTSYTLQTSDNAGLTTLTNAGAIAITLPTASGAGFTAGYASMITVLPGSAAATLTPQSGTINGASNLVMPANSTCGVASDGTNWQVFSCPAAFGGPFLQLAGGTLTGAEILAAGAANLPSLGMNATNRGFYDLGTTENIGLSNAGAASGAIGGAHWMVGLGISINIANNGTAPKMQVHGNGGTAPGNGVAVFSWRAATNDPAAISLVQANNTTIGGTKTAVASGTSLGMVDIEGADGTNFQKSSQILGEVDGTVSSGVVPGRLSILTANASGALTTGWKLDKYQHVANLGPAPTFTCGTGAALSGAANDKAGRITVGTTPGTTCTVTFATAASWVNPPICFAQDETLALPMPVSSVTTSAVTFTLVTLTAADKVSYFCTGVE